MLSTGLSTLVRRTAPAVHAAVLSAALVATTTVASAQGTFLSQNGLLVVEMESAVPVGSWTLSSSTPGFTFDGYFRWDGPNLFNQPGSAGLFGFDFELDQSATWTLSLRNRHEHPDPTEENDVWIKMDNGPWIKVFSNFVGSVGNWTYESRFDLGNQPQATYSLSAGAHHIEFSGRSNGFKMDRVHLHVAGHPGATDPSWPESPRRFGTRFCPVQSNSTGQFSIIDAFGSPHVSENNVILACRRLPQSTLGYYIVSSAQGSPITPPGSVGTLCLGGNIGRYSESVIGTGNAGIAGFRLDLTAIPQPTGDVAVVPGDTWRFQFWHRDSSSQGAVSNFSKGIALQFE